MSIEHERFGGANGSFAALGLTLIVLLGWAAEQHSRAGRHPTRIAYRWLAVTTIALITVAGRIIDALPLGTLQPATGAGPVSPTVPLAEPPSLR